ncbi:hypothetical protein LY76DRAFT_393003 [Colletotrichum caudatum]|nr:hypothetical protein LY76DRAFT_393003 [Colletotrichum caudatum]
MTTWKGIKITEGRGEVLEDLLLGLVFSLVCSALLCFLRPLSLGALSPGRQPSHTPLCPSASATTVSHPRRRLFETFLASVAEGGGKGRRVL